MEEYREKTESEQKSAPEKIDLTNLIQDFYHGFRRLWWLILGLAIICAIQSYFSVSMNYQPNYVASATVSVSGVSGSQSAQEMADVFPYILTSGVLQDVVAEDMGLDAIPGTVDVKAEEGLNLLTISVSSGDPQQAYKTLVSIIKNYPKVAEFVLGETKLTILDETGIPTDTQRIEKIRGSYKRGALKGIIIGCLILLVQILLRRTVKSGKELKKQLNITDCGNIPYVRVKKRRKKTFHNSVSLLNDRIPPTYLEAIRKLRIRVLREMEENKYQTLMITSSIPGEGKTTLATNVAISMAQQGKHVILVDCDVRNPSIAETLNEHRQLPGLVSLLKKEAPLKDAMISVDLPEGSSYGQGSLRVICGGEPEKEGASILGTKVMNGLIAALKKQCDVVILDTAPAELLADAPLLARYADAALYVVRYDHTMMRQIREGVEALMMSGIHILGYVFNEDHSSRSRGYGYGYGYRYGKYGYGYGGYGSKERESGGRTR